MHKWMAAALAMMIALLAGCAGDTGQAYVGRWVNVESQDDVIDIERNGEAFMVRNTTPKFFSRKPKTESYPAVYEDGVLRVSSDGETVSFAIDQADGQLRTGSENYRKLDAAP